MNSQKVFRQQIKEHHGNYFVGYQPADFRFSTAHLQLTFFDDGSDVAIVKNAMEHEAKIWLSRFAVPVMVSAFDAKGDLIHVETGLGQSHLMGYVDPQSGEVIQRWGLLENDELPPEQMDSEYLARVYEGVPFRLQEVVRQNARREALMVGRGIRMIVFLMAGVPLLIEIVSLGVAWLGHILAAVSISAGFYKLAKMMGWLKPSQREKEKADYDLKMKHYYYHCEQNPEGFNRLKNENFEREAIRQSLDEAEALREQRKV